MAQKNKAYLKGHWITNYLPTQIDYADFFDSFLNLTDDLGVVISYGIGAPVVNPLSLNVGALYFDSLNRAVYIVRRPVGLMNIWQLVWTQPADYTNISYIHWSDINIGGSPQTLFSIALPDLQKGDVIDSVYCQLNSNFADSSLVNDLAIKFHILDNGGSGNPDSIIPITGLDLFNNESYTYKFEPSFGFQNIDVIRTADIQFTATDLTMLTAGVVSLFYKVKNLIQI